jgi:hypothetical protein
LAVREGPTPGGRVAERRRKAARAEADRERQKKARPEGGSQAGAMKKRLTGLIG